MKEYITKIQIYKNRNVYPNEIKLGTIGENNIEKLVFNFPEEFQEVQKQIEFEADDWKSFDEIKNNEYIIKNNITKYPTIYAQIKTLGPEKIFISEKIKINFNDYINAEGHIIEENKDLIEKLVDIKVNSIMETTKQELKDYVDECVTEAIGGEY